MKLYVGNLGDQGVITADDLRPLFERFGTVTECECIKTYAFVHIEEESGANEAVQELNGTTIKGRTIKVEKSENRGPRKPSQKLFVGNIKEGTTNEQLKEIFERYCPVVEADVIKNFGFVHIDADAGRGKVNQILRELNGYDLNGSQIRVQLSTSGVRQKPGMAGDACYRCGQPGHWSKECSMDDDRRGPGGYGRNGGAGPMRGSVPYGGRGGGGGSGITMGQGGYGSSRGGSDPYPAPMPPSYMRREMAAAADYDSGYGGGGGAYGRGGLGMRDMDPYYDRRGAPDSSMYDQRRVAASGVDPYGGGGYADRDRGGRSMRASDPYTRGDMYGGGGSYDMGYSSSGYSTGVSSSGAAAYNGSDIYSRRSSGSYLTGGGIGGSGVGYPAPGNGGGSGGMGGAPPVSARGYGPTSRGGGGAYGGGVRGEYY